VTNGTPATAVWTATLPADGEYAVYVWYRPGSDRTPDANYTVHHAGGETTVVMSQQHHGITWRHIGDYGFRGGEVATVTLSNLSSQAGNVVIADAVRFGGGIFDDLTGIETTAPAAPDKPWWEVATFYYAQRMGMEQPPNDVVARPIYARWEHAGTGDDAVYVSWHTNGYNGSVRGTETYAYSEELTRTEGSLTLCHTIHTEIINDIRAGWDPFWTDRGEKTRDLGELRELWDDDPETRMPGVLTEIAFHDNYDDAMALKEPAFQMLAARAVYQGIVKYFEERDGTSLPLLPEPPTHLTVQNAGGGKVRVSWQPSPTDAIGLVGDAATGYRVYTSTDGLGWSNGVSVAGTTAYTITGLAEDQIIFVRVTGTNAGGESFPTEVLAARVGDSADVLLVNGFDRLNSTMLISENDPVEGSNLRMLLDRMNRYDYAIQHGEVITYAFDSASNEGVQDGAVNLDDYKVVDWILGEESTQDETLNDTEQARLSNFLAGGGALFISGAEIGWDLYDQENDYDRAFYTTTLRAEYVADDAETYTVAPATGSIFEGLGSFSFNAAGMYDADYPDQIAPTSGSKSALAYSGGLGGTAAIQYQSEVTTCPRLVYFGFPFETIHPDQRPGVMARVMDFLSPCLTFTSTQHQVYLPLVARNFSPEDGGGGECADLIVNGGFENQDGWMLNQAAYDTAQAHAGTRSARVGVVWPGQISYSSVAQTVELPEGSATLRLWTYPSGSDPNDMHYLVLYDQLGQRHYLDSWLGSAPPWQERVYDLSAYLGQTVTIYVGTRNDGDENAATMYVDDVSLEVCP
ncbi:MAG: N-acetylmuramoyl-L-alanine amidase, partial [Chloroflexi bacterium]|nr:N-acetylmuramoyl-L-alanine amidase [Chloroflexota bacterium]